MRDQVMSQLGQQRPIQSVWFAGFDVRFGSILLQKSAARCIRPG
jgi:hypothetical protein